MASKREPIKAKEYLATSTGGMPHKQHKERNVQVRPTRPEKNTARGPKGN